jgi:hypothetical protein
MHLRTYFLSGSLLSEFDRNLAIYTLRTFSSNLSIKRSRLHSDGSALCILIFLTSLTHFSDRQVIVPCIPNFRGICKQVALHIVYQVSYMLETFLKYCDVYIHC